MSQHDAHQFFTLYQKYRYQHQSDFYYGRHKEFEKARTEAIWLTIILMSLTALSGILASINSFPSWLKLTFLLLAAIFPVLSTAIAAYNTLYAFEQQAKLYQDTINGLLEAQLSAPDPILRPGLNEAEFTTLLDKYVHNVEKVFLIEQGQWGQLAKKMKPPE
jgi:SMODS and SLOG-associating 2TM effector domain 1